MSHQSRARPLLQSPPLSAFQRALALGFATIARARSRVVSRSPRANLPRFRVAMGAAKSIFTRFAVAATGCISNVRVLFFARASGSETGDFDTNHNNSGYANLFVKAGIGERVWQEAPIPPTWHS